MAVKSKTSVKKAAGKAGAGKSAAAPAKGAKPSARPAKPAAKAAKPAAKPKKATPKPAVKPAARQVVKPAVKQAAKPAVKAALAPAKPSKSEAAGKKPASKAALVVPPKRAPIAAGARPIAVVPPRAPQAPMPAPRPVAPKTPAPVSSKDVAAAHEYLLSRSAIRSEAAVIVNGKPLLTEERLLKMPDSAYMNAEQLAFFKHRLQQMERELVANADETTEHLRETVIVPDPADRATIEEEHALELRTRDRERKLLKKVQQALARIDAGDYGYCEETGEPIGIPRLLARPTATLSLEAQQRRELKQKLYGD
jgi:DnaK suppressor protein